MNPDQPPAKASEVEVTRAPASIEVDEDALSPQFRAQMEAVLAPLSVLIIAALFLVNFKKVAKKVVKHEPG